MCLELGSPLEVGLEPGWRQAECCEGWLCPSEFLVEDISSSWKAPLLSLCAACWWKSSPDREKLHCPGGKVGSPCTREVGRRFHLLLTKGHLTAELGSLVFTPFLLSFDEFC